MKCRQKKKEWIAIALVLIALVGHAKAQTCSSISQFGITWAFDQNYECGQFANGDYWIVGPANITKITPEWNGQHHGWEVNPLPGSSQGFDYRISAFNSELVPTLPYAAYPNQSIVKAVSIEPLNDTNCNPCLEVAAVLTVVEEAPPEGSFRPPYVGVDKTFYNINQLRTDLLPSLEPVSDAPSLDSIKNQFQKVQLDHKVAWSGRFMHPKQNMANYGSDICTRLGVGALRLMLNDSIEDKMPALINYVQAGIDFYGTLKNGGSWPADGGHGPGRKWPIIFAGIMLDDPEMKNIGFTTSFNTFGEDCQTFYITQGIIDEYPEYYNTTYYEPLPQPGDAVYGIRACQTQWPGTTRYKQSYRGCCNAQSWIAEILSAHLMNATELWNHDALFDFEDWWMGVWVAADPSRTGLHGSSWANAMWYEYREEYGCVWSYDEANNRYYDCSQCQYNCLQGPYCGDGFCNGNETNETCFYDCPCTDGEQRLCEKQSGVCQGSNETCINTGWPGCDTSLYLGWNSSYEESEASCSDGLDNDCDGCGDATDSDCGGTEMGCSDGIDNDCDGLPDCADTDCEGMADCLPISWYMFGEDASDEMGANNGTLQGNAAIVNDMERGNVLGLDGDGDYVEVTGFPFINPPLTIVFWANQTGHGYYDGIVSRGYVFSSNSNFDFGIRGNVEPHTLYCYWKDVNTLYGGGDGSSDYDWISAGWTQAAVVINSSYDLMLYINGQIVETDTGNSAPADGGQSLRIGSNSGGNDFEGLIDDVMIFDRGLNETDIRQIYCSQGGTASFCPTECVDMPALMNYIGQWKQGKITMPALIQKIAAWKTKQGCS